MSRIGVEVVIELAIRGPILVHGSEIGPWGVDAVALRDPTGRLIIPGDAVQGKVREAFDEIGGDPIERSRKTDMATLDERGLAEEVAENVGAKKKYEEAQKKYEEAKTRNLEAAASRYPMFFSDFTSVEHWPSAGEHTLSQTAIEPETGSTEEGSLRVFDCPVPAGRIARFTGAVRFFEDNEEKAVTTIEGIAKALRWVVSFGSQRSVGFGRNTDMQHETVVRIVSKTVTRFDSLAEARTTHVTARKMLIDFTFEDPLCLPVGVVNGNIFESRDEIPGEALRGALAELLKQIGGLGAKCLDLKEVDVDHPFTELCHAFDRIRIGMARPTTGNHSAPVRVLPKSLAFGDGWLFDFALEADVSGESLFGSHAAAFSHDWKKPQWTAANAYFQTAFPRKELRVRTAIDANGMRRAKDHNLFAYRMLRPEGHRWRATVSIDPSTGDGGELGDSESRLIKSQLLAVLQSSWLSVGKTRARGTGRVVHSLDAPKPVQSLQVRDGEEQVFVITLRGPALMIDPRACVNEKGHMKSLAEIDELYRHYWSKISDGCLSEISERRFKTDSLIGGFQARRYRYCPDKSVDMQQTDNLAARIDQQKTFPYNPTLIVDPGSVFVLKLAEKTTLADAQAKIAQWLADGLPLPDWAKRAYGDTHHTNIFLPQNGYGEIDVNLPCHNASYESPLTTTRG